MSLQGAFEIIDAIREDLPPQLIPVCPVPVTPIIHGLASDHQVLFIELDLFLASRDEVTQLKISTTFTWGNDVALHAEPMKFAMPDESAQILRLHLTQYFVVVDMRGQLLNLEPLLFLAPQVQSAPAFHLTLGMFEGEFVER